AREGHGGDALGRGGAREPEREPRVHEIADEHAGGGARHDAAENEVGGKLEDPDEKAGEDDELRGVVEGEPEERVDVSGREPAWTAAPRRHARRIFAGLPPSSRERALGRGRRGPDTRPGCRAGPSRPRMPGRAPGRAARRP